MTATIGQAAPDFILYDSEKNKVQLAELKGQNVVLLFFPLAFTSTCTKELCHVRDSIAQFNELNARVLGISVDSLYTLAKYKEAQQLNFQLLSDFNKDVSRAYNSLYETFSYGMKGVSKRAVFIVDKMGVLRYEEILENAGELPDFETIQKTLYSIN
jgi:glutaredoxin-dependent peroxiredoxin